MFRHSFNKTVKPHKLYKPNTKYHMGNNNHIKYSDMNRLLIGQYRYNLYDIYGRLNRIDSKLSEITKYVNNNKIESQSQDNNIKDKQHNTEPQQVIFNVRAKNIIITILHIVYWIAFIYMVCVSIICICLIVMLIFMGVI